MQIRVCGSSPHTPAVLHALGAFGHRIHHTEELPEELEARSVSVLLVVDGHAASNTLVQLRRAAARFGSSGRPVILAVTDAPERLDALLEAGADDWLVWPTTQALLEARLRVAFGRFARREDPLDPSRFGRELHEGIGQLVSSAAHVLAALGSEVSPGAAAKLARAGELLDRTRECVRVLAAGLSTAELQPDSRSFRVTLEEAAARARSLFDIECVVDWTNLRELTCARLKAQLSLIVGEAIDNAVRHGGAGHVTLSPRLLGDSAALYIHDNGSGLPTELRSGLGLRAMRRRARTIGGGVELTTNDCGGTTVRIVFSPRPLGGEGSDREPVDSATDVDTPRKDQIGQAEPNALHGLGHAAIERRVAAHRPGGADRR